jgi:hypothetical protein
MTAIDSFDACYVNDLIFGADDELCYGSAWTQPNSPASSITLCELRVRAATDHTRPRTRERTPVQSRRVPILPMQAASATLTTFASGKGETCTPRLRTEVATRFAQSAPSPFGEKGAGPCVPITIEQSVRRSSKPFSSRRLAGAACTAAASIRLRSTTSTTSMVTTNCWRSPTRSKSSLSARSLKKPSNAYFCARIVTG